SINAMVYCRASRHDHEAWCDLGNQGWNYDLVLPYYKKSEAWQRGREGHSPGSEYVDCSSQQGTGAYHGLQGPLSVSNLRHLNPMTRAFIEAGMEIGLRFNDDFNGEYRRGVGFFQVTQKDGKRHSAAAAYLKPALRRKNLEVRTRVQVNRLLFDRLRAVGIETVRDGKVELIRAEREVILSAGAIGSPHLLMLSGIGDSE